MPAVAAGFLLPRTALSRPGCSVLSPPAQRRRTTPAFIFHLTARLCSARRVRERQRAIREPARQCRQMKKPRPARRAVATRKTRLMIILRPPRLYCVFGLQKGHNIDQLPDGCSIGIVGHGRLALPCNLIFWIARKLMPELIRRINDRGHQVPVRDWLIKSPAKHDWNASLGATSWQVRTNDFMAFVAAEAQKGRSTSFDIAIRG